MTRQMTFILATCLLLTSAHILGAADRPNVVFILVDDLSWADVKCFNPDTTYETPNVDRLAAEGVRFTDFYSGGPVCSPTRGSILLGQTPARSGITGFLTHPGRDPAYLRGQLPPEATTIGEAFKGHGYATGYFGKWHLGYRAEEQPTKHGFDMFVGGMDLAWAWNLAHPDREAPMLDRRKGHTRFFSPHHLTWMENGPDDEYLTDRLTNETIDFIRRNRERSFFAFLSFHTVHTPLQPKKEALSKWTERYRQLGTLGKPDSKRQKQLQNVPEYAAMVQHMDENVGRLVAAVDEMGLRENTIVVFTSDNGGKGSVTSNLPLNGYKHNLYEGGIRIPTVVRWPNRLKAGTTIRTPLITHDFYPTLLDMCSLPLKPDEHMDGRSFADTATGGPEPTRDGICWHYPHGVQQGAVRRGPWKLLMHYKTGKAELYNLAKDLGEKHDVAPENKTMVAELLRKHETWRKATGAKFPKGLPAASLLTTDAGPDGAKAETRLKIVAFGDSTTATRKTVNAIYAARLPGLLGPHGIQAEVVNAGVPGSHTGRLTDNARHRKQHALDRLDTAVRAHKPDIVVVQFGINDSWVDSDLAEDASRIPLADYRRNLTAIVGTLKKDGARVILMTPNKIGGKHEDWRVARLGGYAEAVRSVASEQEAELVDVWGAYEAFEGAVAGKRTELMLDGSHPNDRGHELVATLLAARIGGQAEVAPATPAVSPNPMESVTLPLVDLDGLEQHHVLVDREPGQYLGHPTTCLLEDGKTMLCVYPKGHGRGAIVYKRSADGGKTWSDRLPTPESWATSKEVPTLHRVVAPDGTKRIIMWSGLYPARLAVSEDDGLTWGELQKVGDWGGIVVMGFVEKLSTGPGHYFAMFHDDGRFFKGGSGKSYGGVPTGKRTRTMTLYQTFSRDGGLTWSEPEAVYASSEVHLCEPGCIRSPDGKTLAVLLRENARRKNSHVIFSADEGKSWSVPRELPLALTGDRHTGKYGPDGRLFISFRCRSPRSRAAKRPFEGDWVGWVGTWDDIVNGTQGQYQVRCKDNTHGYDTTYPGVEILPNGTFVATTYGHWAKGEKPYILSARFTLTDIDVLAARPAPAASDQDPGVGTRQTSSGKKGAK